MKHESYKTQDHACRVVNDGRGILFMVAVRDDDSFVQACYQHLLPDMGKWLGSFYFCAMDEKPTFVGSMLMDSEPTPKEVLKQAVSLMAQLADNSPLLRAMADKINPDWKRRN